MRIADYLEYYEPKEWVIRKRFHSRGELAWELIRGIQASKRIAGSCILRKEHSLLTYSVLPNKPFSGWFCSLNLRGRNDQNSISFIPELECHPKERNLINSMRSHFGIVPQKCTLTNSPVTLVYRTDRVKWLITCPLGKLEQVCYIRLFRKMCRAMS